MYAYFLVAMLLSSSVTYAQRACDIKTIREFYNNVKVNGPLLNEAIKNKEVISSSIDIAEQRPNPELDFEYLKGDQFGVDVNTYTLTAKHVVEFGSKRDKRLLKAKNYQKLKNAEVDLSLFNSNLNATIGYQRVAQLNVTIDSVKEAIHTFEKIINKLSSRERLNPEETVSLSTLRLASNDYKAQLNDLESEKTLLQGKISFLSNCKNINPKYEYINFNLVKIDETQTNSVGLPQIEDLKVELAVSELDIQKSLGYSNISIGPTVEHQTVGNDEFVSAGISVSFALPLFQTNNGGKLNALKGVGSQKVATSNNKEMLRIERMNLVTKLKRSLSTLSKMPKLKELESKHLKVEKLFSRGVVSIPMTIESHRQQVEFIKSKFDTENDVLNTYGKILLIDGNITAFEKLL
ncbi:MAG: hypothetical protein QF441_16845 [Bacteriovoracaceae bacterium]|jgi:cobalt-zinc-cadmium efflux system outer membrane protein|nr:hypothetical protein [Bacteriovoracaceae bacterium]